jgi:hypothetical protein
VPAFELSPSCSQGVEPTPCTDPDDAPNSRESATDLGSLAGDRSTSRLHTQGKICAGDSDWFRFELREDQTDKTKDLSASVSLAPGSGDSLDVCVYTADGTLVACSSGRNDLQDVLVHAADDPAKDDGTTFFVDVVGTSPSGTNDYKLKIKEGDG